jgi:uncharacterized membrane protein YeaQ/YmgE (transglycosylase-associated protein family)
MPPPDQSTDREFSFMSIIAWIVLGLIAGFLGSKIVNKSGEGALLDIVLGIVGAVVGGFVFNAFGAAGVTGFNIYSLIVATSSSTTRLQAAARSDATPGGRA